MFEQSFIEGFFVFCVLFRGDFFWFFVVVLGFFVKIKNLKINSKSTFVV